MTWTSGGGFYWTGWNEEKPVGESNPAQLQVWIVAVENQDLYKPISFSGMSTTDFLERLLKCPEMAYNNRYFLGGGNSNMCYVHPYLGK